MAYTNVDIEVQQGSNRKDYRISAPVQQMKGRLRPTQVLEIHVLCRQNYACDKLNNRNKKKQKTKQKTFLVAVQEKTGGKK